MERIAKVIARAGICSRRDAEKLIAAGRVSVNGTKIDSPALNVGEGDEITVDGKPLEAKSAVRMWRYHKPKGLITTHRDPAGRPTVFDSLPKYLPRVISVGRLDFNTEGLLLLTNDGEIARKLELPATSWIRRYKVRVHGKVDPKGLEQLRKGVVFEGMKYAPVEVDLEREQGTNAWLNVAVREGKKREIRKLMEAIGLEVTRLIRTSYGPFQLGSLESGEVAEISGKILKEQLGL